MALAVGCIYAVDFAINGGERFFWEDCWRGALVLTNDRHSAGDVPQPRRGYTSRVSAATWLSVGSVPYPSPLSIVR